jgi:hypothetical protein
LEGAETGMEDFYFEDRKKLTAVFTQLKPELDTLQLQKDEFFVECRFYEDTEPPRIDVEFVIQKKEWMKNRESKWIPPLVKITEPMIEVVEKITGDEIQKIADIIGRNLGKLSYKRVKSPHWSKWVIYANWVKKDGKPAAWK